MLSMQEQHAQVSGKSDFAMKVSVIILTYNHEPYIVQAIDSVLMQKTNFTYEIIIAEDCSTDRTREIVIEYKTVHPEKLRLLLPDHNLGVHRNYIQAVSACKGEYIAYLDGDDYWLDPKKLQKQVDFLEAHCELSMCFTGVQSIDEEGSLLNENKVPEEYRKVLTQKDIVSGYVPPSLSVVTRNYSLHFPDMVYRFINLDYFECAMIAEYGDVGYLPDVTACHRIHRGGVWSLKNEEYYASENLKVREALLEHFGNTYREVLVPKVDYYFGQLIHEYIKLRRSGLLFSTCFRYFKFLLIFKPLDFLSKSVRTTWRIVSGLTS